MRWHKDIYYSHTRDSAHMLDLCLPDGEPTALLLYFHGGGFVEGSRDLTPMTHFAEDMTDAGIAVASVEYRMYPSAKYPDFIEDAAEAMGATIFHAGTKKDGDKFLTAGGRVLGVTATGKDLETALNNAYAGAKKITFDKVHYRNDIGKRALAALK